MASSENQGLQIALIIFVILTLVLSVTTFLFFRQYQQADLLAQENNKKASENMQANQVTIAANNELKEMMGYAASDNLDAIQKQHKTDMETWAGTLPEEARSYRKALEALNTTLNERSTSLGGEAEKNTALAATLTASEEKKNAQVEIHKQEATAAQGDLAAERAKFVDGAKRLETQLAANQADKEKMRDELTQAAAEAAKEIQQLNKIVIETRGIADNFRDERNALMDPTFEVADGQIVWIDQSSGVVWINIGRDDSLKRKTTFSIYTSEANDLADPQPKGKIEVTQILGQHLAEARILEDSLSDPLLIGDLIHTPIWTPGRAERFALAGLLDLDGDGTSDRAAVRNLILQSGGVIDYELLDDGTESGEMTQQTRFLVLGEESADLEGVSKVNQRARDLGLESLKLAQFLDHMGFKDPKRVLRFGVTPYEEFQPPRKDGQPRTAPNTNFSKRFTPRKPRDKRNTTYDAPPVTAPAGVPQ